MQVAVSVFMELRTKKIVEEKAPVILLGVLAPAL